MSSKRPRLLLGLLVLAAAAAALAWPGDAPWIYDEPRVIGLALRHLRAGTLPWAGIIGSHGVLYGPVPVWLYECLLVFTHDLVTLVAAHAALFWLGCGTAVLALAALCPELAGPAGGAALFSPYLWFYSRLLWDNTLLMPLSGLAVCLYLSHTQQPKAWKLAAVTAALWLCFETHLMSLAVIAPIGLHAAWSAGPWLRQRRGFALALLAAALLACGPYLAALARSAAEAVPSPLGSPWLGWVFPLQGGRLFSGLGLAYFLGDDWPVSTAERLARSVSGAALPLIWAGMALAAARAREGLRAPGRRDAAFHMSLLALGAAACQCLFYGLARVYGHPHYLGPAWIFNLFFLWNGLSALGAWRRPAAWVYGLSLAAATATTIVRLHGAGGTRGIHYGPTLANQIAIGRELNGYHPGHIAMGVQHYQLFPEALATLMDLNDWPGDPSAAPRRLAIVYRDPSGTDGRIRLVVQDN